MGGGGVFLCVSCGGMFRGGEFVDSTLFFMCVVWFPLLFGPAEEGQTYLIIRFAQISGDVLVVSFAGCVF